MLTPPKRPMRPGEPAPPATVCPLAGRAVASVGEAPSLDFARDLLASLGTVVGAQPKGPVLGVLDARPHQDPVLPAQAGVPARSRGGRPRAAGSIYAAERPVVRVSRTPAAADWALSGAMALTGPPEGPPALSPGAPASALSGALAVFELLSRARASENEPVCGLPGSWLLGERAALAGLTRQAPRSVGGAFRAMRAADGWFGLSLARPDDIDLLPALIGGELTGAGVGDDPWQAVAAWLGGCEVQTAVSRACLLALPAAAIPPDPVPARRPPVLCTPGGPRRDDQARPLVVDLTSLWAGPLCAHLLGLAGAQVVKVESRGRPDGARTGTPAFFDLLHGGHLSVALDFGSPDDIAALRRLLARADVILEASRPRALRQLGIDAAEYVAGGTVWASITAYGRTGHDAQRIGFGDDVAAAAGLVARSGLVPYPVGDAIADPLAGAYAAAAVAAGLLSSRGQLLDVSMFDVAVAAGARAPDQDAEVLAAGPGRWAIRTGELTTPVRAPRARRPAAAAAHLGQHTRAVLDDLTRRHRGPGRD